MTWVDPTSSSLPVQAAFSAESLHSCLTRRSAEFAEQIPPLPSCSKGKDQQENSSARVVACRFLRMPIR